MISRLRVVFALVVCTAFVAAACGGEVTVSDDGGTATPTTETPDTAEPTTTEPADSGETPDDEPTTTEPADSGETPDDEPTTTEPADSGETPDDEPTTTEPADSGETPDDEPTTTEPAEPEGPPPNIFDDPRDGIFDEFQATMDRSDHPFMQIDQFCTRHEPAPNRIATDVGIEADSISIVHLRSKLEELADIGFGTDVGDPAEMFETFATVVNEQCGGVRGRMIDMHLIELAMLSDTVDEERNAACIHATEDLNGVILVNSSGFQGSASLCIVEEHETAFVSVQTQTEEFISRGNDRLITISPTSEELLRWHALDLLERGELEGKTVGVVAQDTPGQSEAVQAGLVDVLEGQGINVAVFDVLGCQGGNVCAAGNVESAQRMKAAGVNVFFNNLNVISAPLYIIEMLNQGFGPGDVQFYASDFNSQAGELVSSKILQFGGAAGGALYNGAKILDARDVGAYRLEGYEPRAFNEMCNDTYGENSPSGANHESEDRYDGNSRYGMAVAVCEIMRIVLRAIYDAGDNPTREDVYTALANLGPIDSNEMYPASIRPGKTRTPDVIHNLIFEYPCTKPYPFIVDGHDEGICIYPVTEYRPAPA